MMVAWETIRDFPRRSQGVAVPIITVPVLVPVMAPAGELGTKDQGSKITRNSRFVVCKDDTLI